MKQHVLESAKAYVALVVGIATALLGVYGPDTTVGEVLTVIVAIGGAVAVWTVPNAVIDASGNHFVCPTSSTTTPIAYNLPDTTAVKGSIGPDSWAEVAMVGATHLNPVPAGIRYMAP